MRLPDIPRRHRKLACAVAVAGTTALALVRRRDFAPEHERALRFGTALANAGLTWVTGSRAFLGHADDPASIAERGRPETIGASDSWWDEQAGVTSESFINVATAVATGAASWAFWPLTNKLVEAVDSRLPAGVGRGLSAAVDGGIVALAAVVVDKVGEWAVDDDETEELLTLDRWPRREDLTIRLDRE